MIRKQPLRYLLTILIVVFSTAAYGQADKKQLFFISNTHLDTQWNWDVKTTINEYVKNTLTQNMALMDKYPAFMLNYEGAIKYMWMKEYYPSEYEKMKGYITTGQWHVSGMSVDASDVMISSAESILHSMAYANNFYMTEFGVRGGYDIMLPDCFGFSYALPSLAHHAGVKGFHTAKLGWGSSAYDKLAPFGIWQGVDGSQIYGIYKPGAYDNHESYNKDMTTDADMISTINSNYSKYGVAAEIRYVGPRSDHGGGLQDNSSSDGENTPYWLNYSAQKNNGTIKVSLATPDDIFDYLDKYKNSKYQLWNDELPMRTHGVGAYTSRGEMKLFNRKDELLADATEKASSLAYYLGVRDYPYDQIRDAWIRMLWQQHHDGITGTSIPKAYEYSVNEYYIANRELASELTNSINAMARHLDTNVTGTPIVVYNPLSHQRTDIVEGTMPCATEPAGLKVTDKDGNEVLSQITGYKDGQLSFIFAATVPSLGCAVYDVNEAEAPTSLTSDLTVDTDKRQISNGRYRFGISTNGDLRLVYDLLNKRTLTGTIQQQMLYDHEDTWPAWEISYTDEYRNPKGYVDENVQMDLTEDGPLRKAYRIQRTKEGSTFVQYVRMNALSNRIDCVNEVDWQSHERMLKLNVPFQFSNDNATYDISLGTIQRGLSTTDDYEFQGHEWADQSEATGQYGVSILNDCKYGWDKSKANSIRLTLLHTPSCGSYKHQADMDIGANNFTYSIFPHDGGWNQETQKEAAHLNQPLIGFVTAKHPGELGRELSFVDLSTDKVAVKALTKSAYTDELLIRVYELVGEDQKNVTMSFPSNILNAREVNALEEEQGAIEFWDNKLTFDIDHYQPKTFAVELENNEQASYISDDANFSIVSLDYNIDMMSYDSNPGNAATAYTYAFPAEQVADYVMADGIPFVMGPREDSKANALRCTNQTITLNREEGQRYLYLLMSSADEDGTKVTVKAGDKEQTINVPYFSGWAGQTATTYNLGAQYRTDNIGLLATHAHNVSGKSNEIMRFLYMYIYKVELPDGVNEITITGNNRKAMLYAATLSNMDTEETKPFSEIHTVVDYKELGDAAACGDKLVPSTVAYSSQNGSNEAAAKANDDDPTTKWCVTNQEDPYIEYRFKEPVQVCQYMLLNAGIESSDYITSSYKIQYYTEDGTWEDMDIVTENTENKIVRGLNPVETTRIRLQIVQGEQDGKTTRVYEFAVYGKNASETAIKEVKEDNSALDDEPVGIYTIDGIRLDKPCKGINIIRYKNGKAIKVKN